MSSRLFAEAGRLRLSRPGFDAQTETDPDNLFLDTDWTEIGVVHQTGILVNGTPAPVSPALPYKPFCLVRWREDVSAVPGLDWQFYKRLVVQGGPLSNTRWDYDAFAVLCDGSTIDVRVQTYAPGVIPQTGFEFHYIIFRISIE